MDVLSDSSEHGTYAAEGVADTLLVGVTVAAGLTLLLAKDLAGVLDDITQVLEALLNILDVQALLAGLQAALGVHGSDVLLGSGDDVLEVVDHLL